MFKSEDDTNVWLVELDVIGFLGTVFIEAFGDNPEEAWQCAQETIASRKMNDCEVKNVSQVVEHF